MAPERCTTGVASSESYIFILNLRMVMGVPDAALSRLARSLR